LNNPVLIEIKKQEFLMTSKERVIEAINLREPDTVPVFITITPQVAEELSKHLGIKEYTIADSPLSQNRISFHELMIKLGNDIVGIGACSPNNEPTREIDKGIFRNEWKVKYRKIGYYMEMIEHPLSHAETAADIENFHFPEPKADGRFTLAKQVAEKYGSKYAICGDLECTVFETSWYLTGMEKFLMDLFMEKEYVFTLMDRVMEYSIGAGLELVRLGSDIIWVGDDMGTQHGMLISPEMWRKHLKGRLKNVIAELKKENPDIKIAYHSCGSYFPIIPELIEIGVDILNALQPRAKDMELARLKGMFGNRASFFGGMDIQDIIPFGTMEEIEKEVKRVIHTAAKGGGYILAGAHNIQPDTSVEKLMKIFEVAKSYGKYPIA